MIFEFFTIKEIFKQCDDAEISLCVTTGCCDTLLELVRFLDSFRDYIETPIVITSSFRSSEHNEKVGGVRTSQHMLGQAVDFMTPAMPNNCTIEKLKEFIKLSALSECLGQVVFYNNFIHIGLRTPSHKILTFYDKRNGKNHH